MEIVGSGAYLPRDWRLSEDTIRRRLAAYQARQVNPESNTQVQKRSEQELEDRGSGGDHREPEGNDRDVQGGSEASERSTALRIYEKLYRAAFGVTPAEDRRSEVGEAARASNAEARPVAEKVLYAATAITMSKTLKGQGRATQRRRHA